MNKKKCVHIMIYLKVYLNAWSGMHPHKKTTAPPNKQGNLPDFQTYHQLEKQIL